jgi:hypothetical protein
LRTKNGSRLYLRACDDVRKIDTVDAVNAWLYGRAQIPVYFFGDLDYAGMQILANLREVFPGAEAWRLGYEFLAQLVRSGGGHRADMADKEGQVDGGVVGCDFTDSVLRPLIRETGKFADQEAFCVIRTTSSLQGTWVLQAFADRITDVNGTIAHGNWPSSFPRGNFQRCLSARFLSSCMTAHKMNVSDLV